LCNFFSAGGYSGVMYAYVGEFNVTKYRAAVISWIGVAVGLSTISMPCKKENFIFYELI